MLIWNLDLFLGFEHFLIRMVYLNEKYQIGCTFGVIIIVLAKIGYVYGLVTKKMFLPDSFNIYSFILLLFFIQIFLQFFFKYL